MQIYRRNEIANILNIKPQNVPKSWKVIECLEWSARSKKYVKRYLLINEIINEKLIKKRFKENTW